MTPRTPPDVRDGMLALLPPGWATPREAGSRLGRLLSAPARRVAAVEAEAADLAMEIDPRTATNLLADFERLLGPDPCDPGAALTLGERRVLAHGRLTAGGGQSRAFFIAIAAARGVAVTIEEFRPFTTGAARTGRRLATRSCRFFWRVRLGPTRLVNFRIGASSTGQSLGAIEASAVECPIRRLAPAHTTPLFAYGAP